MKSEDVGVLVFAVFVIVVIIAVGIVAINDVRSHPYIPPRYAGDVITAQCFERYGAVVVNMSAGGERSFDVDTRECVFVSAHVNSTVSFEISPGGTYAYNFALEVDHQ